MYPLIASNFVLNEIAQNLYTELNSGHFLQLYQNNFAPNPASSLFDFQPCNFAGYTAFNMAGSVGKPIKQVDGDYILSFQTSLFGCESGTQTIYGAYISSGNQIKFSQRFPTPYVVVAGSSFVLPVVISILSLSLILS